MNDKLIGLKAYMVSDPAKLEGIIEKMDDRFVLRYPKFGKIAPIEDPKDIVITEEICGYCMSRGENFDDGLCEVCYYKTREF
jgi:hypothetical protein